MRKQTILGATVAFGVVLTAAASVAQVRQGNPGPYLAQPAPAALSPAVIHPLKCSLGGGDVVAPAYVSNPWPVALPAGINIQWQATSGEGGILTLGPAGLPGNSSVYAGNVNAHATCNAWIAG